MAKIGKKPTDDQLLEGGGGGGGYKSMPKKSSNPDSEAMGTIAKGFGIPLGVAGAGVAYKKMTSKEEEAPKVDTKSQAVQEAKDAATQVKKDKAYNAAKTYPDNFAKGGMTASRRADGIAQRGKTRGTLIR